MLLLLEEGASTLAIARRLGIAPSTTKDHLDSIYTKAGITSRLQLVTSSSSQDVDLTQLGLTPKQQQVARLMLNGDTNPAIAQKLYLSHETVRHHLQAVYRQLGVGNRYEAIVLLNRSARPYAAPRR
ncbi:MAG: LuxR C-terminal-related transcriptional regulator [Gaiellaceae bacterium]